MSARRLAALSAAVVSAVALVAVPSGADVGDCRVIRPATETTEAVSVCREDVFMHAGGASRVGNTSAQTGFPSWSTTAPTGDRTAGSVYVSGRPAEQFLLRNRTLRPTFQGTYTGVLDNMAVRL